MAPTIKFRIANMEIGNNLRIVIRAEIQQDNSFIAYLVCDNKVIARAHGTTPENARENLGGHSVAISDLMTLGAGAK